MPAKNSRKIYVPNSFYHIYNRGVEKRVIFLDEQDYRVFIYYLELYLSPKEEIIDKIKDQINLTEDEKNSRISKILILNNFYNKIELLCFILMPNHFHIMLKQIERNSMELFMNSLTMKYVQYFNKKYKRVGPLFQGRYKAVLIDKEEYLLHLSRYIHINIKELLDKNQLLSSYQWSSYPAYVKGLSINWLRKDYILYYFKKSNGFSFSSYQGFVEGYEETSEKEQNIYKKLFLD